MRLTDVEIRRRLPQDKPFKLSDGRGLYLLVRPSGSRWWRFKYRFAGKEKGLSLGTYPDVSLAKARAKRELLRQQVADGKDPAVLRKLAAAQTPVLFEAVARDWLARQTRHYAPATSLRVWISLRRHILPELGAIPVDQLNAPTILEALTTIERNGKHETAHRAKQHIGMILRYAITRGLASRDHTADLKGALQPVLTEHHAAILDPPQIGHLLRLIDAYPGSPTIRAALRLAPLVFVRPGELRRAEWSEIDLPGAIWRVSAGKVKTRTAYLVPLSRQAVAILTEWREFQEPGRWVFPHPRTTLRPMSDAALSSGLKRLGYTSKELTPHGFRAMARTLLDEVLRVQPDMIEVQLGHVVRGALGATYNRSLYLEARIEMMQRYADYLDTLRER